METENTDVRLPSPSPQPHELKLSQRRQSQRTRPSRPCYEITHQRNPLTLSNSANQSLSTLTMFRQQAHEKDKKKEKEALTKCRGGGGEGCAEAGLQVNDFGVFRFFLRFSLPPLSVVNSSFFD